MTASAAETACRVMVFARAPGEAKTRLIPALGEAGAAALHRRLVMHCPRAAREARLRPGGLWWGPRGGGPLFRGCGGRPRGGPPAPGGGGLGARLPPAV